MTAFRRWLEPSWTGNQNSYIANEIYFMAMTVPVTRSFRSQSSYYGGGKARAPFLRCFILRYLFSLMQTPRRGYALLAFLDNFLRWPIENGYKLVLARHLNINLLYVSAQCDLIQTFEWNACVYTITSHPYSEWLCNITILGDSFSWQWRER